MQSYKGKTVLIFGLGRAGGGIAAARFFAERGASVRVADEAESGELKQGIEQLKDIEVDYRLGVLNKKDLAGVDLAVINPAIPPFHHFLKDIESFGIPKTTEVNIFLENCRGEIIGVTGTNGKETVVRMIDLIFKQEKRANRLSGNIYLGGNIGGSLLGELSAIKKSDKVIFEFSSFQLERIKWIKRRPKVAVLSNIAPDHLEWHRTFQDYKDAKLNILRGQGKGGSAVINLDDKVLAREVGKAEGRVIRTGSSVLYDIYYSNGKIKAQWNGKEVESPLGLKVPGKHNIANAMLALGVAMRYKLDFYSSLNSLERFSGSPNALEFVLEDKNGVRYYNDSEATNAEATVAALEAFDSPIHLIVGGYDKGIDLSSVVRKAKKSCKTVAVIGQLANKLYRSFSKSGVAALKADTLDRAVALLKKRAVSGDIVLLSPASSSFDQFRNLDERGNLFKRLVNKDVS